MKMLKTSALLLGMAMTSQPMLGADDLGSINGKPITPKMFNEAIGKLGPQADMVRGNPMYRQQFFDHYVNTQLLSIVAEQGGLDKSKEFQDRMNDIRKEVLAKMYADNYLEKEANDKNAKVYFEKNKAQFGNKEVKASHILIEDEATAKKVLDDAKKANADFAALAKQHSKDPGSGQNGGDLGFFGRGRMVPEFEKVAFTMAKGKMHPELVKSQFGYHIIKVTDVRGDDKADFAKVKDQVKQRLKAQLQEDLVKDLRAKNKVIVNDKAVKEAKL